MQKILRMFTAYVVAFMLISCICGLVYAAVQQDLRQTANDPQIQIAEDAASAVKSGKTPVFGPDKTDLNTNLGAWLAVYDKDGNPTDASATLDSELPKLPKGLFDTAKSRGEFRVTWMPKPEVRQAVVIVAVGNEAGGFVAAGRSLRDVEARENQNLQFAAAAWVVMIVISFLAILVFEQTKDGPKSSEDTKPTEPIQG